MSPTHALPVEPKSTIFNPDPSDLKKMVAEMPNAARSEFGNYNVTTKVLSRSKASTFIVTDHPEKHSGGAISTVEGARIASLQNAYIKDQDMIVVDGYIGPDPKTNTAVRLIIERRFANIAAMQQQLYFPVPKAERDTFVPTLTVIYTPGLKAEGFPQERLIAVDLETNITRVFNSDYFGESKKGGLRMWNNLIHNKGGLAMHAGLKAIPTRDGEKTLLIIGLSGTGKTTTTFTRQNGSRPIQDDFVAMLPSGEVLCSENGCFAKTYGLDAESEPMIHGAVTKSIAYLENVSMDGRGHVNFFDESYTQNGRATFPFDAIDGLPAPTTMPKAHAVLILNRNETIIPCVAKLNAEQGAAYFMLGETMGTSAGGAEEAGKALRVPGTNPFFPLNHALQGERFLELQQRLGFDVYLLNTGWVGGPKGSAHSMKVKIRHTSAVVKAIAEGTITWTQDNDFGYQVASSVPGFEGDDRLLLQPKQAYEATGRLPEYMNIVNRLKNERKTFLDKYPGLPDSLSEAVA